MLFVEYCPNGAAFPDHTVEEEALRIFNENVEHIQVSTENIILAFRALVADGVIPAHKIKFIYNGIDIPVGEKGEVISGPKGFCDVQSDFVYRIYKNFLKRNG